MELSVGSFENRFEANWHIEDCVPAVHRPCRVGPFHAYRSVRPRCSDRVVFPTFNPLNAELNPICHLLALVGVHHFLHVSRIRVKSLTLRLLMSYTGCPRRNVPDFGRVFLMLKYTDITQSTYVQS